MNLGAKNMVSLFKSVINWPLPGSSLVWLVVTLIAVIPAFMYFIIIQNSNFTTGSETLKIGAVILVILYSAIGIASYIYHTMLTEEHSDYSTLGQDIQMVPRFISTWFLPLTSILLVVISQIATIPESQNEEITFQEFNITSKTLQELISNMEKGSSTNETTMLKEVVDQIMQSEESDDKVVSDQSTSDSEQDSHRSRFMNQIKIMQKLSQQMTALQQYVDQVRAKKKDDNPHPSYAYLLVFAFSTSVVLLMIGTEMAYIAQSHHGDHRWLVIVTASLFVDFLSYFLLINGLRAPLPNEPSVVPVAKNTFTFLLGLFSGVSSYYTITRARMADEVLDPPSRNLDSQIQ